MRVYEELFIVKPDAPEEEVDGFIEQVKQVITTGHGNVDKVDNWGVRKLAYKISKYNEGRYVLVVFSSFAWSWFTKSERRECSVAFDPGDQIHHRAG